LNLLDHYSFRARLQPALLVLLPLAIGILAWTWPNIKWESVLWGLFTTAGGAYFLTIIARNLGKEIEPKLWKSWGGAPTTQLLRHSGILNPILRERWHNKLSLILGKPFPTQQEEVANSKETDNIYKAAVTILRIKTRDIKTYNLVYNENVSYGFCRNLYAMRKIGIIIALFGAILNCYAGIRLIYMNEVYSSYIIPLACLSINILFLFLWVFKIKPSWVKTSAFAYARRLLETTENL